MRSLQPASILDLGAYSNPISNFLQHCPREVTIVEPCGELAVNAAKPSSSLASSGVVDPWLSAARPCLAESGRQYVLTVSPATAASFFGSHAVHQYDAVVCLGCDALIQHGVRRSMLLKQLRRPVDIFLEYPLAYTPSRQQFAVSAEDEPSSAAAWTAANCSLVKMARLTFPEANVSYPTIGLSSSRVLQHVRCR